MSRGDARSPVALIILDGWGCAAPGPGNAVSLAATPVFDGIWESCPHTTLTASGESVGLPAGQMGNSEVGHLNLGAGRIVYQDLERINRAISDGSFVQRPALVAAIDRAREKTDTLHVMGLLSSGGVHSHVRHIESIVEAAAAAGVGTIAVHAFTDGRDVSPTASLDDIPAFEEFLARIETTYSCTARVATIMGRYWAMDRDNRWDRTQRAYDAVVAATGRQADTATEAVRASHADGVTDEFVEPHVIWSDDVAGSTEVGEFDLRIGADDVVVFANFRPDRTRQLCHAFRDDEFHGFDRIEFVRPDLVTMTEYDTLLQVPELFPPHNVHETLADVLAEHGIGQLHVAETEKYPHVTYFFNGGVEQEHTGEKRVLVDSPRDVATYDLAPAMSARAARDEFVTGIADESVGFAIINFANPDMVGHTGVIPAVVEAVQTADACLGDVLAAIEARGGVALVTADHGNAEQMLTPDGKPHTAHTTNPVPFIVVGDDGATLREGGILGDVAPTILDLMGVEQPAEMTGRSLVG